MSAVHAVPIPVEEREEWLKRAPIRKTNGSPRCGDNSIEARCGRAPGHEGLHVNFYGSWASGGAIWPECYWVRSMNE